MGCCSTANRTRTVSLNDVALARRNEWIEAEKWGSHKSWLDQNFCRRLRNMRSIKT